MSKRLLTIASIISVFALSACGDDDTNMPPKRQDNPEIQQLCERAENAMREAREQDRQDTQEYRDVEESYEELCL